MCIPFSLSHKKKISYCSNYKDANTYRYITQCDFGKLNYGILSANYFLIFIIIFCLIIFIILYFYINVRIIYINFIYIVN